MNPIAKAFGIEEPQVSATEIKVTPEVVESHTKNLKSRVSSNIGQDYDFARDNIRDIISSSMETVPDLIELIKQAESPRMYESGAAFLKMLAELNKDLLSISNEIEKGESNKKVAAPVASTEGGTTNVYIGTGSDVFDRLSKRRQLDPVIQVLPVINEEGS